LAVELGFDLDDLDPLLLPFALPLLEETETDALASTLDWETDQAASLKECMDPDEAHGRDGEEEEEEDKCEGNIIDRLGGRAWL
jgi:hypothetical protein